MPKFEMEAVPEVRSAFFERRRLRRIRMIVELTLNMIGTDDNVSHREARCLVDCAHKAILELHPGFVDRYERIVRPHFEHVMARRWPEEAPLDPCGTELVN
jgi:hypothetical protein